MRALIPVLLPLALVAAAPAVAAADDAERYRHCLDLAQSDAARAITQATQWRASGGGIPARHCLALAYGQQGDFAAAATELVAAARAAETTHDPHAADLWGQAGNAALLAKQPAAAIADLTSGIAVAGSEPVRLAALLTDRARALVEANRTTEAKADLTRATGLDPSTVTGWLLLATLDRRLGDLAAAERAILEAARREPDDPDVALEAGNIAGAQGRIDLARTEWKKVLDHAPGSDAAEAAAKSLALNPG
jgi:tetratricopeptide (TPR) repeat protein